MSIEPSNLSLIQRAENSTILRELQHDQASLYPSAFSKIRGIKKLGVCSLLTHVPRNLSDPANVSFRATVFRSFGNRNRRIASDGAGPKAILVSVERAIRWLLAV
jgi:hypothetical protein